LTFWRMINFSISDQDPGVLASHHRRVHRHLLLRPDAVVGAPGPQPSQGQHRHRPTLQRRHRRAGRRHPHTRLPPGMLYANTPRSSPPSNSTAPSPPGWPLQLSHTPSSRYVVCQYSQSIARIQACSAVAVAAVTLTLAFLQICCTLILKKHRDSPALHRRHCRAGHQHFHIRLAPDYFFCR
jgi:hypothetical protein